MGIYFHQDFLERPDGTRLYYQVQGEGEVGLVLNDGLGCDGFAWKYLLPKLRENYRVVRWHYRGHGQSSVPVDRQRIGMSCTCEDLAAILDVAQLSQAVLFGHSMGVQVALEFHRQHPGRVLALVLLCGSYGHPLDTFHDSTMLKTALPYIKRVVERFPRAVRAFNRLAMSTELAVEFALSLELNRELMNRGDLIPYFDHLSKMDPVVFVKTLESLADHSAFDHLPEVHVPTLVVGGEQDKFTPPWLSHKMAETIPGAELLMVPGGSHTAPLEAPDLIWKHVEPFLTQHLAPAPTPGRVTKRKRSARSAKGAA